MSNSVKSWCDACQVAFERTGYGCDGHPMCAKPVAPEGHRLTGDKELTDTGWREGVEAVADAPCSHPAAMRQPRLPSGTRCGACDETFS